MNKNGFLDLANNSNLIGSEQTLELNEIIEAYPYFQAARALQLKGLKNSKSFKYNSELKKTAAYTIDRTILFDFITKSVTVKVPILKEEKIEKNIIEEVNDSLITKSEFEESLEINFIKKDIEAASASEILEIGKPIEFKSSEPHSFNEWMQLIQQKPIERELPIKEDKKPTKLENKLNLIDKFISSNPKIKPIDKSVKNFDVSNESSSSNESLMTETLAKVYLEQKKYESAIKAYRILSLKYPEKSSFFANRIKAIKILQKNKS